MSPASALPAALLGLALAALPAAAAEPEAPPAPSIDSILEGFELVPPATDEPEEAPAPPQPQPQPERQPYVPSYQRYDEVIVARARAAQAERGPLDGGWTLGTPDGLPLYRFQFSNAGTDYGSAEGAWRTLTGPTGPRGSGLVALIGYDGAQLMLRFVESGPEDLVVVTVKPQGDGSWSGELWRKGVTTPVVFRRG